MMSTLVTLARHVGGQTGTSGMDRRGASKVGISAARQLVMAPRLDTSLACARGRRILSGAARGCAKLHSSSVEVIKSPACALLHDARVAFIARDVRNDGPIHDGASL